MTVSPGPREPGAVHFASADLHGRLVSGEAGSRAPSRKRNVRLYHDGHHWQLWSVKPNRCVTWFRSDDVELVQILDTSRLERRIPDWAMALGIATLPCFLIGVVFFFAKETVRVQAAVVELTLTSGQVVAVEIPNVKAAELQDALLDGPGSAH